MTRQTTLRPAPEETNVPGSSSFLQPTARVPLPPLPLDDGPARIAFDSNFDSPGFAYRVTTLHRDLFLAMVSSLHGMVKCVMQMINVLHVNGMFCISPSESKLRFGGGSYSFRSSGAGAGGLAPARLRRRRTYGSRGAGGGGPPEAWALGLEDLREPRPQP